jgi:hypothetical protein
VAIGAGLGLKRQQALSLARPLFSSPHPQGTCPRAVEDAVVAQALALLYRRGRAARVIGDKGVGRQGMILRLAHREQDEVLRVDADSTVDPFAAPTAAC